MWGSQGEHFDHIRQREDWRDVVASDNPVSVRALVYILAGHPLYHLNDLKEKYLPAFSTQ